MPLIAGLFRFTWGQFLPAVIVAALLWSGIYMLPGIVLGALALEFPPEQLTKVFLSGLILIVIIWMLFWVIQFFFKQLIKAINQRIQRWWQSLQQHRISLLLTRLLRNHQNPDDYRQLSLLLVLIVTTVLLCLFIISVSQHSLLINANQPLLYLSQSLRTEFRDQFWVLITLLGTPEGLIVTSLLAGLCLAWYKQWRAATHLVLLSFLTAVAIKGIKSLVFSPRPSSFLWVDPSSSFPSGHTTMSVAILGFLAFLTAKVLSGFWRRVSNLLFIIAIFLISLSRLFLGQHWFTDILAGWCLGSCLLLVMVISYRRLPKANAELFISRSRWLLILMVSLLLPWGINIYLNFQNTVRDTTPHWRQITLSYQQWWNHPTQEVPTYRRDRFGNIAQPFNVQWAGNLKDIQNFLVNRGWYPFEIRSSTTALVERFTSLQPEHNMPLLDWQYQNKPPTLFFIKHLAHSQDILELRLWNSGVKFTDSRLPLWIGIITYHTPPEKLLKFPHHSIRVESGYVLLQMPSQFKSFQAKVVRVPTEQQPYRIHSLHWDGEIFILRY